MSRLHRMALVVIAAGSVVVGMWAQAFPRSFYDDFPGAGRVWVAVDGPYNEHLVRDVGGLNLALGFVAVLALMTGSLVVARAAGGGALLYGVPHLAYHARNLGGFDLGYSSAMLVSLGMVVFAGLVAVAPSTAAGGAPAGRVPPGPARPSDASS